MKKILIYSLTALSLAALVLSCQKAQEVFVQDNNPNKVTLTCAFPALENEDGTKVTLGTDGKTAWEADVDQIVFQGKPEHSAVIHTFTSAELTNPEVASFDVDLSGLTIDEGMNQDYNAAYPASLWSPYSTHMYGRSSFSETNHMLMAGYVDGSSVILKHMTAAIVFKVAGTVGDYDSYTFEGNNGETVGYSKLLVEINKPNVVSYRRKYLTSAPYGSAGPMTKISGDVVSDGTTVNTIFLPVNTERSGDAPYTYNPTSENGANVVYLPNGFTIKLLKEGVVKKYITAQAPLTITPGHMINLGVLPADKLYDVVDVHPSSISTEGATALDGTANANCYIVSGASANQVFTFKAYKGNSTGGVGTVKSASIIWETYNDDTASASINVIEDVDFEKKADKDYYTMVFQMPASIHAGNALIAAKDEGGAILWSWHIWVPSTAITSNTYGIHATKQIMDRNLGALTVPVADAANSQAAGFLYQWGRKDPLMPIANFADGTVATSNPASVWTTSSTQLTTSNMHKTPCVFIKGNNDWLSTRENTLWTSTKQINDPCPEGYRVPEYGYTNLFDYFTIDSYNGWSFSDENYNFTIGVKADPTDPVAVFPFGHRTKSGGYDISGTNNRVMIWTATYKGDSEQEKARAVSVQAVNNRSCTGQYKAIGAYVRCIVE